VTKHGLDLRDGVRSIAGGRRWSGGYSGKQVRIRLTARRTKRQEKKLGADLDPKDKSLLETRLLANPDKVRLRVYPNKFHTQINVLPAARIDGAREGPGFPHRRKNSSMRLFFTHASTSPNLQIMLMKVHGAAHTELVMANQLALACARE